MNYREWYRKISEPFRTELAEQAIIVSDKALVALIALVYIASIALLAVQGDFLRVLRMVVVPALTFLLVSYLRIRWNAPRPYEV